MFVLKISGIKKKSFVIWFSLIYSYFTALGHLKRSLVYVYKNEKALATIKAFVVIMICQFKKLWL